jgi:hypothetical protein
LGISRIISPPVLLLPVVWQISLPLHSTPKKNRPPRLFFLLNPKYFTIFAPCFYETQRHIAQSSLNHHLRNELIIKIGTAPYGRRLPVFDDGLW